MTDREESKLRLISEEAAEWFVRIKDHDLDTTDQRTYVRWLKESPAHVAEFLRVSQGYLRYRKAQLPSFEPDTSIESNVVDLRPLLEVEPADGLAEPEQRSRMATWKIAATVAAVSLSLLVGVVAKTIWLDRTIETGAGEWRQIALTDGSTMRVLPLTEVKIKFSDQRRTIELVRGEAFFQVAKDKHRPFVVNSGLASVRAVGTQFAVSRVTGEVVVTVSEGRVAVTQTEAPRVAQVQTEISVPPPAELPVSANEQVKVSKDTWPTEVKKVDASNVLAWTRQQLVFSTETISEAAAAFNRLNRVQISVDDPEIAQWRACCAFDATDPESFAEAMAEESGIALIRDPFGVLHLVGEDASGEGPQERTESPTIQADAF